LTKRISDIDLTEPNCWHSTLPCGVSDRRAIHIDHIKGDGHKSRIKFKNTQNMFRYYINNPEEAKLNIQPLCSNCNVVKVHLNNEFNRKGRPLIKD